MSISLVSNVMCDTRDGYRRARSPPPRLLHTHTYFPFSPIWAPKPYKEVKHLTNNLPYISSLPSIPMPSSNISKILYLILSPGSVHGGLSFHRALSKGLPCPIFKHLHYRNPPPPLLLPTFSRWAIIVSVT